MLGRTLYGAVFTLAIPALLIAWAIATAEAVQLPVFHWPVIGSVVAVTGFALIAAAMWGLWHRGGGLPMNAFPPKRFVFSGVYRVIAHPIYVGFGFVCFGVSLAVGSASGFWLVSPVTILGVVAMVYGYERDAIHARFGPPPGQTLFRIPRDEPASPEVWDRVSVLVLVLLPWCVLYEAIGHLPVPGAIDTQLGFERGWPVWTWSTVVYSLAYPFVIVSPWVMRTKHALRRFVVVGSVATVVGMLSYVVIPVIAVPRPFDEGEALGWLLRLEQADGLRGRNALPAFHVFWAMAAAAAWSTRGWAWGIGGWVVGAMIIASCLTTGMHAMLDLLGGAALFAVAWCGGAVWRGTLRLAERAANSWHEWRIGPIRVINHGLYAGAAATVGVLVASWLAGPELASSLASIAVFAVIGAAIWGQVLVGSRTLLRPFGYFGAILGAMLGISVAAWRGEPFWVVAAALAAAAPLIVLIGRLRCLVQGCCHGRPVVAVPGIRYTRLRSRVCRIAKLDGVPVHPTPVYSMAASAVLGLLLLRLWWVSAPLSIIAGVYLLGAGLSRFVEEHFRGEPQTQIVGGLRIYQWFAAASVLAGIGVTCLPSGPAVMAGSLTWEAGWFAIAVGAMFAVAMGVDLPESERRFSRLV